MLSRTAPFGGSVLLSVASLRGSVLPPSIAPLRQFRTGCRRLRLARVIPVPDDVVTNPDRLAL